MTPKKRLNIAPANTERGNANLEKLKENLAEGNVAETAMPLQISKPLHYEEMLGSHQCQVKGLARNCISRKMWRNAKRSNETEAVLLLQ
eukprot:c45100_g1_i1 orf=200-466(+)